MLRQTGILAENNGRHRVKAGMLNLGLGYIGVMLGVIILGYVGVILGFYGVICYCSTSTNVSRRNFLNRLVIARVKGSCRLLRNPESLKKP